MACIYSRDGETAVSANFWSSTGEVRSIPYGADSPNYYFYPANCNFLMLEWPSIVSKPIPVRFTRRSPSIDPNNERKEPLGLKLYSLS